MEKINVSIDVNVNLSESTQKFLTALFTGHAPAATVASTPGKPAIPAKPEAPKPAATAAPAKPVPTTTVATPAPSAPAAPAASSATEITIDAIRKIVSAKSTTHREELKKKLNELGAKNVTTLDTSHYEEFYNYISSL